MNMNLTDKDAIKTSIIQLPDLEELLTMSTPAFCDENDDALIVYNDRVIKEDPTPFEQIDGDPVFVEMVEPAKTDLATFNDVTFSSKGIQINGVNDVFKEMVNNQIVKEYTLTKAPVAITGPITLGLLCELKKLNGNEAVTNKINAEIDNITTNFCKIRGLVFRTTQVEQPIDGETAKLLQVTPPHSNAAEIDVVANINDDIEAEGSNAKAEPPKRKIYVANLYPDSPPPPPLAEVSNATGKKTQKRKRYVANLYPDSPPPPPLAAEFDVVGNKTQKQKRYAANVKTRKRKPAVPNYVKDTESYSRKRKIGIVESRTDILNSSLSSNKSLLPLPPSKRNPKSEKNGGSSRRHKKASRKRNGRKIIHKTRRRKHH